MPASFLKPFVSYCASTFWSYCLYYHIYQSTSGSVTYKLSEYIATILKQLNGKISSSYLLNTDNFVEKIRNVDLHNKIMVSFDVSSLFTNVPIEDTLDFLKNYLQSHTEDMPFNSDVLLKLIDLCTNNCYFSCNGNFFRQKRGLLMGSFISPVLSNIYMEFFERYLLPSIVNFELVWLRYVDDVFAVLNDDIDLDHFLTSLNRISPSIKFTIEK